MTSWPQHIIRQQHDLSKQLQEGFQILVRSAVAMNVGLLLLSLVTAYVIVTVVVTRSLTEEAKDQARHMVDVMQTAIEGFVPPGTVIGPMMDPAAQEGIKRMIRNARYDDPNGYFLLFAVDGWTIAQGIDQGFEGTNRRYATDADGIHHILLLSETANRGGGFVQYKWKKLDNGKPTLKISYAKLLRGGQWWIATGVYLDSVDEVIGDIRTTQGLYLLGLAGVLFLFLSAGYQFGNVLGENIAQPVVEQMKGLARMADDERGSFSGALHKLAGSVAGPLRRTLPKMARAEDATSRQKLLKDALKTISLFDQNSQRLEREIFPRVVLRHGAATALKYSVEELREDSDFPEVDFDINESVCRSDTRRESALYLVAQGLLQNVHKHAKATKVRITLVAQAENVMLTITDNGKGFNVAPVLQQASSAQKRFGTQWMFAIVELYGGPCPKIISSPGQGTTVQVIMPWPKTARA